MSRRVFFLWQALPPTYFYDTLFREGKMTFENTPLQRNIVMALTLPKGEVSVNEEFCKGCERCVSACPHKLLSMSGQINKYGYYPAIFADPEAKCSGCALCAVVCPDIAIEVFKEKGER